MFKWLIREPNPWFLEYSHKILVRAERTELAYESCICKLQLLHGNPTAENTPSPSLFAVDKRCHPSTVAFGNHCYSSAVQESQMVLKKQTEQGVTDTDSNGAA